jgi:hypothetical protein
VPNRTKSHTGTVTASAHETRRPSAKVTQIRDRTETNSRTAHHKTKRKRSPALEQYWIYKCPPTTATSPTHTTKTMNAKMGGGKKKRQGRKNNSKNEGKKWVQIIVAAATECRRLLFLPTHTARGESSERQTVRITRTENKKQPTSAVSAARASMLAPRAAQTGKQFKQ